MLAATSMESVQGKYQVGQINYSRVHSKDSYSIYIYNVQSLLSLHWHLSWCQISFYKIASKRNCAPTGWWSFWVFSPKHQQNQLGHDTPQAREVGPRPTLSPAKNCRHDRYTIFTMFARWPTLIYVWFEHTLDIQLNLRKILHSFSKTPQSTSKGVWMTRDTSWNKMFIVIVDDSLCTWNELSIGL